MKYSRIMTLVLAAAVLAVVASGSASAATISLNGPYWSQWSGSASWTQEPSGTYNVVTNDVVKLTSYLKDNSGTAGTVGTQYSSGGVILDDNWSTGIVAFGSASHTASPSVRSVPNTGYYVGMTHKYFGASSGQSSQVYLLKTA